MGGPAPGGAFSESWLFGAPVGPGRTDPPLDPSDEGCDHGGDASPVASWYAARRPPIRVVDLHLPDLPGSPGLGPREDFGPVGSG